jgi:hypothetical protein
MKWILASAITLVLGVAVPGFAQSLEDLNIQIHGYATQGLLYTTTNNIFTTHSADGSPAWTDAVINIGAQPTPKLRIAFQARYFLLGNYGNEIALDWAAADYKVDDRFGVRFGRVKTPIGLFNEVQGYRPFVSLGTVARERLSHRQPHLLSYPLRWSDLRRCRLEPQIRKA